MKAKKNTLELKKLTSAIKVSRLAYAGMFAGLLSPLAHAGPEGGVVTGGSGTIDVNGTTTTIDQNTDLLSIDWDSFNLSAEELVKFLQPNTSSVVLNRILDQSASTIHGSIEANGHVILVNPRGVLFTESATINVGAITASGLDMSPEDFMNGNFTFKGEDGSAGFVVNRGVINAASAVLVGKQVTNASSGLISAELVSLAAADEAILTFDADGMIGVQVTKEVMENDLGVDSAVLNEGNIDGAQVLLEASVSGDLFTAAVNNEGTIKAQGIDTSGGKIRLFGSGSSVINSGELQVAGTTGGQVVLEGDTAEHRGKIDVRSTAGRGGEAMVLGDEVLVSGAIDARGTVAGGEVLIGGDYQGKNSQVRNAEKTTVTKDAHINASGIGEGDGGEVIVWADHTTNFAGTILAESGEQSGDGGFVETSGKVNLFFDEDFMSVSTAAKSGGETGLWLLDPGWLDITDGCGVDVVNCISSSTLTSKLSNNNITITVSDENTASTDIGDVGVNKDSSADSPFSYGIRVSDNLSWSSGKSLTLDSYSNVQVSTGVTIKAEDGKFYVVANGSFENYGEIDVKRVGFKVGSSFKNYGDIKFNGKVNGDKVGFYLEVGINGDGSQNVLGNLFYTNNDESQDFIITGGAGTDGFILNDQNDQITVTGDKAFTLSKYASDNSNFTFSDIESIDTAGGEDTVTSTVNSAEWTLTSLDNQVNHSGINFLNAEVFSGGKGVLQGASNSNDSYQIVKNADSTTAIQVDGMSFNGLTRVEAGAHAGVNTTDILLGTDGADTFGFLNGELHTYNISFTGIEEVNAGGMSNDGVSDQLNTETDVDLTGNQEELRNANILFKDIEQVEFINSSNGKIVGSAVDDSFIIANTADKITANNIEFTGFNKTIDTGEGTDTVSTLVADSTWSLSNTNREATSSGITFTNIEKVTASDNQGTLESKNDDNEFALTNDGRIDADSIRFTGFTTIEGNGAASLNASAISGNLLLLDDNKVKADFTDDNIIDITISGINEAVASKLLGTDIAYTVKDANKVFAKAITFSGVDRIEDDGSSGAATSEVSDQQWQLVSADNEVEHSGITFAGMHSLTGGNNTLAGAADKGDSYQLSLTGDITVDSMIFKGIRTVNANTVSSSYTDTVGATGAVTLQGNNAFGVTIDPNGSSYDINFSGIDAVTNTGTLTGTAGADAFTVEGDKKLRSKGIQFSDVSAVLAGSDASFVDTVYALASKTVELTGNAKELITSNIVFKEIEVAGTGGEKLVGSGFADTIEITGDRAFKANEIAFTGISSLNTGGGTDSIIDGTGQTGSQWILGAESEEITGYNIAFSDVETIQADTGELVGRNDQDETFKLSAYTDNGQQKTKIDTKGMAFTGIGILSAGDSNSFTDTIESSVNNSNWALTAIDNQVEHAGVTINDADILSGGKGILQGASNSNDSYQIVKNADSTTAIQVDGMSFNGLTRVEAGAHAGVNTTDILLGTDGADTFGFLNGELHTYNISFTGIEEVNAGGMSNDGVSDQLNTETDVDLTGNQEELRNANILFKDIEQVEFINSSNGKIVGSAVDDSFIIANTADKITANNIEFTGFNKTIDTGEGTDTVSTLVADSTWSLSNTNREATSSGITFTNIEKVTASDNQGTLESKNDDNEFALTNDGRIDADSIRFTGFTTIEGNGAASLNASAISGNLLLLDDNKVKADFTDDNIIDITISGINEAVASKLLGTDIAYTVKDANKVFAKAITFSGVDRIEDDGSSGAATSEVSDQQWQLVSADNEVEHSGITFAGMHSLTGGNNTLAGAADKGDSYQLSLTGDITVDSMIFKGIRTVNANTVSSSYTDTVGATGAVTLQGNNAFGVTIDPNGSSYDINFSGIDAVTNTGTLTGTAGADAFTVEGDKKLRSKGIQFSDVSAVLAGSDASFVDTVYALASKTVELTGNAKELITSNIVFKEIEVAGTGGEKLVGSGFADTIEITGDRAFKANEIAFTGISSLNTGGGTDSIIDGTGQTGSQWILGAESEEITGYNIAFSDVETIQADTGELVGRNDQDETFKLSAYTDNGQQKTKIDTKGMAFTGIGILSAGDSNSFTDTIESSVNNSNWALTAIDNQVEHAGVTINDADILSGGKGILQGASNSNDSYQIVKNADSTTAIQVDGMSFNGLTRVEAGAHAGVNTTDILLGTDGADTFGFLNGELHTYNISFTGIEEVNAGGMSNDGVSDQLNTETDVDLTGNQEELRNANILFKDIEQVEFINSSNGKIVGSAVDDSFIIATTADKITANNIEFTGFNKTIDTGEGTDTVSTLVADSTWSLSNTNREATSSGITFTNIEKVTASDNQGTLESKNDDNEFALTNDGRIDADTIRFTGFTTIEGNGAASLNASAISGNLLLLDDNKVKADFTDDNIIDITISGINEAVASKLLGTDIAYTVKDANKVFAKAITFSGVDRIEDDGSSGAATSEVSDQQWQLVSADNEVEHSGITFAGMHSLTGGNNTLAGAADKGDSYQLSLTGDITVDSMIFKGIRTVNANTVSSSYTDTVGATGAVTLQGNNAFGVTIDPNGSSYDINFSGIDAVTNTGTLTGTAGADAFTVEGDKKLRSKGIQFSDVSAVLAGSDASFVDTVYALASKTVELTGNAKELITSNIVFKEIEVAGTGGEKLVGSGFADTIEITGDRAFKANEIAFTGISSLNTGGGTDSIIDGTGQTGSQWILGAESEEITGYNIAFSDVETIQADTGELVGRNDQDETFKLSAYTDNGQQKTKIDTKGMAFTGIGILSAGDSNSFTDTIESSVNNSNWALTAIDNQVEHAGVTINDADILSGGKGILQGASNSNDSYQIVKNADSTTAIQVDGMSFNGLTRVEAGAHAGVNTTDILLGTDGADTFGFLNGELHTYNISFTGIEEVNAGGMSNDGVSDQLNTETDVDLTGNQEELRNANILFKDIEQVEFINSSNGKIVGSAVDDSFIIANTADKITANNIEFTGFNKTIDTGEGTDTVSTLVADSTWSLSNTNREATSSGITFTNIEKVTASDNQGTLESKNDDNEFALTNDGRIDADSIRFTGFTTIEGNGAASLNASAISGNLLLLDDNKVKADFTDDNIIDITISGINEAVASKLLGTDIAYTVKDANKVFAKAITFSGVDRIEDDGSSGAATSEVSDQQWQLVSADNEVEHSGITFAGMHSLTGGNNTLAGAADKGDSYQLSLTGDITVDSMIFKGIRTVNANTVSSSYTDTVGATGAVTLQGNNAFGVTIDPNGSSYDINFSGIDAVTNTGTLTGTAGADAFTVEGDKKLRSKGIQFSDVSAVLAGSDASFVDTVYALASKTVELTGNAKELITSNIVFKEIEVAGTGGEKLVGSGFADTIEITGDRAFKANEIAFTGISSLNTGGGTDSIIDGTGQTGSQWILGAESEEITGYNIAFSDVETIQADTGELVGRNDQDETFKLSAYTDNGQQKTKIDTKGMAFTGIGILSAGDSNSFTDTIESSVNNSNWALTAIDNQVEHAGVTINDADILSGGKGILQGASNSNDSYQIVKNADSTTAIQVDGMSFNGLTRVEAGAHAGVNTTDILLGTDGADTFGFLNGELHTYNISFTGIEEVNAGGMSNDGVSDQLNTETDVDLTGNQEELRNANILFKDIEQVEFINSSNGKIVGSAVDDSFIIANTADKITANNIEFTGFNKTIDTGEGTDTVSTLVADSTWSLSNTNREATSSGITFTNIEKVTASDNQGTLESKNDDNEFALTNDGRIDADSIRFTGFTTIEGNGAASLNASAISGNLLLLDDNKVKADFTDDNIIDITISGINEAVASKLLGTDIAYTVKDANKVFAKAITFSGVDRIEDDGSSGAATSEVSDQQWQLVSADNEVEHSGITFAGMHSLTGGNNTLAGAADKGDSYQLSLTGDITVDSMIFKGIRTVNANTVSSSYTDTVGATGAVTLQGNNAFGVTIDPNGSSYDINFSGIDAVTNTGTLTGTAGEDAFTVEGDKKLRSKGIQFSDVSAVLAGSDASFVDTVYALAGKTVELTGIAKELITSNIVFKEIEVAGTGGENLVGSDLADTIEITGDKAFKANEIAFTGISSLNTGEGTDTVSTNVANSAWSLSNTDNKATSSGITFTNIEKVTASDSQGTLESKNDDNEFALTNDGRIDADTIRFTGFTTIEGNGTASLDASAISGNLLLLDDNKVKADFTDDNIIDITISGINEAVASKLLGTDIAYTVKDANKVFAKAITFSGVDRIEDDGSNSAATSEVSDQQWQLVSADNEVEHSGITFAGMHSLTGGNNTLAGATDKGDSYQLSLTGDITVDSMIFKGIRTVNANTVSGSYTDTVGATGAVTLQGNNAFGVTIDPNGSSYDINFSGIDAVTNTGTLTGTAGEDAFTVEGDKKLRSKGIQFSDVSAVLAGSDASLVDTVYALAGETVELTGIAKELITSGIVFKEIEVAGTGGENLVGSDLADTIEITGDKAFKANEIAFTGISSLNTGEGTDTVSTNVANSAWSLSNTDNKATSSGITFTNIEKVTASDSQGTLESKNDDNEFALTNDGRIDADTIRFTGFTTIEGNGTASLDASAISGNLLLLDDNKVKADFTDDNIIDITISGINEAVASKLLGTDIAYTVKDANKVFAKSITFSGVDRIEDDGSSGAATSEVSDQQWQLVSADNEVEHSGITFAGMHSLTGGNNTLAGATDKGDSYQLSLTGDITVDSMIFKGIRTVNANTVSGSYTDTVGATGAVTLQGNNAFGVTIDPNGSSYDINFSGIDAVTNTGTLTGTAGEDAFTVEGDKKLRSKGIQFTDITAVLAGEGNDTVSTLVADSTWSLSNTDREATSSGITFTNIEKVTASDSQGTLESKNDDNEFALTNDGRIDADSIRFTGFTTIEGNGTASLNASAISGNLLLLDDNKVKADFTDDNIIDITISGINEAVASKLLGTDIAYTVKDANKVFAKAITFSGVDRIVDTGSSGAVTSETSDQWELISADNEVKHSGITFAGMHSLTGGNNTLAGAADKGDSYQLSLTGDITVDSMIFKGIRTVNANTVSSSYTDTVGATGAVTLQGNNAFGVTIDPNGSSYDINFSGIDAVTNTGTLTGTAGEDAFTVEGDKKLRSKGIQFLDVSAVLAGSDASFVDTVYALASKTVELTGNAKELITSNIVFKEIEVAGTGGEKLVGSGFADTIEITGDRAFKANEIAFTKISSLNTGGGTDSIIDGTGQTGSQWILGAESEEITGYNIAFSDVETIQADTGELVGRNDQDETFKLSAYTDNGQQKTKIDTKGMAFTGIGILSAGDSNSFTDTIESSVNNSNWALTAIDNQVEHAGVTINDADILSGGKGILQGASNSNDSYQIVKNTDSTTAIQVDGMSFNGLTRVEAGTYAGTDILLGTNDSEIFTFNSNAELLVNGLTFSGFETVNALGGDDYVNAENYSYGLELTATAGELRLYSQGLLFQDIQEAYTTTLYGTDNIDAFSIIENGTDNLVVASAIDFSGVTLVDALGGQDTLSVGEANLENGKINGIQFVNLSDIISSSIFIGASQEGDFYVLGDGLVSSDTDSQNPGYEFNFSGVTSVKTNGYARTVTGLAGHSWIINNTNTATNNGITFFDVSYLIANNAGLEGYSNLGWALTANDNEVSHAGIIIKNANLISGGTSTLTGGNFADTYTFLDGGNQGQLVKVDDMQFTGLSTVAAAGGDDIVIGQTGKGWALTGNADEVKHGTITIQNAEFISGGTSTLTGGDFADTYTFLDGGNQGQLVKVDDMQFTGLSTVAAAGGDDIVIGQTGKGWALTGNADEVKHGTITIQNAEFISGGTSTLTGGDFADTYTFLDGGNQGQLVKVDDMQFAGLSTVAAAGGDDIVIGQTGKGWALTGNADEVKHGTITIQNAEFISGGTSTLTGGDFADTYTFLDGGNQGQLVKVDDMQFAGLSTVAAAGGDDIVIGQTGKGWALTGNADEVKHGTITIQNAEFISGGTSTLTGGDFADTYTFLDGGNQGQLVKVDDMQFAGLSTIAAAGGDDIVIGQTGKGWALTGNADEVKHGTITIQNAEFISGGTSTLTGGDFADTYTFLDGGNQGQLVKVDDMQFAGLSTVAAAGGDDIVIGQTGKGWALTGNADEVKHGTITIQNAEFISGGTSTLTGGDFADTYTFLDGGNQGQLVKVDDMQFAGLSTVAAAGGDDIVIGQTGKGWALTGNADEVKHGTITIQNAEFISGGTSTLTGGDFADTYTFLDGGNQDQLVKVDDMQFAGLSTVAAAGGDDIVIGQTGKGWALTGNADEVKHGTITIQNAEFISGGTSTLTGGDFADTYTFLDGGNQGQLVKVDDMQFAGLSTVAAAGGDDIVIGQTGKGWALTGNADEVKHGTITIQNAEFISGGTSRLTGGEFTDTFTLSKSGADAIVQVDNMTFMELDSVDAGDGSDTIVATSDIAGETWVLGLGSGALAVAGVSFEGVEQVDADNVTLDASTNNQADTFELAKTGKSLKARGIEFSSVASVSAGSGNDDSDTIQSDAGSWQLAGTGNALEVNGVQFSGIDSVATNNAQLYGTDGDDAIALTESGIATAGIAFTGITKVSSAGGTDHLVGTSAKDTFVLASNGDITAAGILFSGLESVDTGEGEDTVNAAGSGASWTSSSSGSSLENGGAQARVNGLTVLFDNLEMVQGVGTYIGQDIGSNYVFDSLNSMTVAGVTFADLESLSAGSGNDTIQGASIDAVWDINDVQSTVSGDNKKLLFSGIEAINAGSGQDTFNLNGGELASIDTGAGNDTVILSATTIDSISLGEGDDYVEVNENSSDTVALSGGSGSDSFQYNLAGDTWQVKSSGNKVGNFSFSDFEFLDNTSSNLTLETDFAFDFENGGVNSGSFNKSGVGLRFAGSGMRLGYDGNGDINVLSSATGTIGGSLKAKRADLVVSGDVNIESDVDVIAISTSGPDVDITVLAKDDLLIDEINAGRGNVQLASAGFGTLTAETYGDTHITANNITLGTDTELWTIIGSELVPLRMDALTNVEIVSVSYYEPEFIGQVPNFTSKGDELQSIAGAQASQGLRSAIQNGVEDFTQVDPAIFSAVKPYSSGVDALNSPEMRLRSGELQPAAALSGTDEEEDPEFDARLEESQDVTADFREQETLASNNAGG